MERINQRQTKIIEFLEDKEFVSVKDLAEALDVSMVTIRKDLSILERNGYLYRTHGGASKKDRYAFERPVNEKQTIQVEEKAQIAKKAATFVSENDFLVLGSGTTVNYLAKELLKMNRLTVCTPSLNVSMTLAENLLINIIQIGGELRKSSHSVIGSIAENGIRQFSSHLLFLGVDGIDLKFGISTSNAAEAKLNQVMIEQSDKVVVLADSTKINKKGFGKIADIDCVDILITTKSADAQYLKALEENGIEVYVV
ncbi:DeoR family transcriptional regulator [Flavobacteriaceae bacterium Ap0902]|nr:DeoR family transcriptional regulator [Flavobacteriaceae bacterium Ap0902]